MNEWRLDNLVGEIGNTRRVSGPRLVVLIQSDPDVLFDPDEWESEAGMVARGQYFLHWLARRKEKHVVVCSHGCFLMTMFEKVLEAPRDMREWWGNAEYRRVAVLFP